jgi:hypothetical protein
MAKESLPLARTMRHLVADVDETARIRSQQSGQRQQMWAKALHRVHGLEEIQFAEAALVSCIRDGKQLPDSVQLNKAT